MENGKKVLIDAAFLPDKETEQNYCPNCGAKIDGGAD